MSCEDDVPNSHDGNVNEWMIVDALYVSLGQTRFTFPEGY